MESDRIYKSRVEPVFAVELPNSKITRKDYFGLDGLMSRILSYNASKSSSTVTVCTVRFGSASLCLEVRFRCGGVANEISNADDNLQWSNRSTRVDPWEDRATNGSDLQCSKRCNEVGGRVGGAPMLVADIKTPFYA